MTSQLTITPTFESSITSLADASAIEASIDAAVGRLENEVTTNTAVAISIDFGNMDTGLGQSTTPQADLAYPRYLADLKANPNKSANDQTALANMPVGANTGINGATQVRLTAANLSALGETTLANDMVRANGGFDGQIGLNLAIINDSRPGADPNNYDLQSVVAHEVDEVLGIGGDATTLYRPGSGAATALPTDVGVLDFFRYAAPGVRSFTYDTTRPAYFSIDGGVVKLVDFNQQNNLGGSDFGDWGNPAGTGQGNTPGQVQDAFGTPGETANLGASELTAFDVAGWNLTPGGMALDGLATPVPSAIGGTQAGQATTDRAALNPFAAISISDANAGAPTETVTVTASDTANGVLADPNAVADHSTLVGGVYTVGGTAEQVQAYLRALVFTPTARQVAPGQTVTTGFTIGDTNSAAQTVTDGTASVVATAVNDAPISITGPAGGYGSLTGTPGADVIDAYGRYNRILGQGGADVIHAGSGDGYVDVAGGSATVTLGGDGNVVVGGDGNVTVTGAPGGHSQVTLGNGNDTVLLGGLGDTIRLGNGDNSVSVTQGMAFIRTGSGHNMITVAGSGSTIDLGSDAAASRQNPRHSLTAEGWNHQPSTLGRLLGVSDGGNGTSLPALSRGGGTAVAMLDGSSISRGADLLNHRPLTG